MRALRTTTRVTATLTAAGVMALAAGPAFAADTTVVAQSEAEAIYLSIGPQVISDNLSGQYRAERTAQGETTEGNNQPNARLLTGQPNLKAGVLAQDAQTGLAGNRGVSEACSGVAGQGSTIVGVGGDRRCLTPGDRSEIALTPEGLNLDTLLDTELVRGTGTLGQILSPITDRTQINRILREANTAITTALEPFGNAGLFASFRALTSECAAGPGETATGDANLAGAGLFLRFPDPAPEQRIDLVDIEANPDPNTPLVAGIDEVFELIADAALESLETAGFPTELTTQLDNVKQEVKRQILANAADQLGPVQDNLLDGTLNKQTTASGEIEVTAIDLDVLPVAEQQAGFVPVELRLARSQCGPGATLTDTPTTPTDPDSPDVPRVVPAGVGTPLDGVAARGNDATVPAALALLALMTFGSAVGFSTSRSRADA